MDRDTSATAASSSMKEYFDRDNLKRSDVAMKVQFRLEVELNKTVADLPMICSSKERVQALHDASVQIEKDVFPDRTDHERLEILFEKAIANRKFCHVDTKSILEDEGWDAFFRSLESEKEG